MDVRRKRESWFRLSRRDNLRRADTQGTFFERDWTRRVGINKFMKIIVMAAVICGSGYP